MFNHVEHAFDTIEQINLEGVRLYRTPTGEKYPSVTSVTGILGKADIMEWRKRVGEEEANRIGARAAARGTRVHSLCEDYLNNKDPVVDIFDSMMWKSLKTVLHRINNIHCLETRLFSHHLKVAGTVDCIAEFDGKLSVIDFKTSTRIKTRDDIHHYFMQTSAYAVMFEERTGIPVSRLVIIMATDEGDTLVFKEKRDTWIREFIEVRNDYSKLYNR